MRIVGVAGSGRGLGAHDHLCWIYDHADELFTTAVEFLADGVAQGQRVGYLGHLGRERMTAELGRLTADHPGDRPAFAQDLSDWYRSDGIISPGDQIDTYAVAMADAIRSGYTGLRVVADCTDLVGTSAGREAFARYEHLIDRRMTSTPLSGMCAYDRATLGERAADELACLHPVSNRPDTFGVFAIDQETVGLRGELDGAVRPQLVRALTRVSFPHGTVVVDATEARFLDQHALGALAGVARHRGRPVVLRTSSPAHVRLTRILGITDLVRVELVA
ncbi:MAG: MEDS domain-containing protein [Actinomycetota bacterium]|nr:MEDS domain-containing protein [Actinomycetota bacterium]